MGHLSSNLTMLNFGLDKFHIIIYKYIYMKEVVQTLKILSDESRLRILMLCDKKELCVCQIMGVLNMSQPLISRNLSLLAREGFLDSRRDGKLMFYKVKKRLTGRHLMVMSILRRLLRDDRALKKDLLSLKECEEFQKKTGKCDMETFLAYMRKKNRNR